MHGFKEWLLGEMPITNWQMQGDWGRQAKRQYGFNKVDAGILGNPKGVAKIQQKWSNTKQNYEFYFIRDAKASKFQQVGKVTPEWVQQNIGLQIEPNEDAITILFTNNRGAEKIPMTAWMIAHRMGHVLFGNDNFNEHFWNEVLKDMSEILKDVYGINAGYARYGKYGSSGSIDNRQAMTGLFYQIGTMNSADRRKLTTPYEFIFELFAQYLITGRIKFKPLQPQFILKARMAWGRPAHDMARSRIDPQELQEMNELLEGYAEKYEYNLDSILGGIVGEIFVM
jgi:hypothetical protein